MLSSGATRAPQGSSGDVQYNGQSFNLPAAPQTFTIRKSSPLGQAINADDDIPNVGLHDFLNLSTTYAEKLAGIQAKRDDAQAKADALADNNKVLNAYVGSFEPELQDRWGQSKDPQAQRYLRMQLSELHAAQQESSRTGSSTALTQSMARLRQWQSPYEQQQAANAKLAQEAGDRLKARQDTETFNSYNQTSNALEKEAAGVDEKAATYATLRDTLDQHTAAADSTAAPQLIKLVAGGRNSGVRITSAEINAVFGSQNAWEKAKADISRWSTDAKDNHLIGDTYRNQLAQLANMVGQKVLAKQQLYQHARTALAMPGATVQSHRDTWVGLHNALDAVDNPQTAPTGDPVEDLLRKHGLGGGQ